MTTVIDKILGDADRSLECALRSEGAARLDAMTEFMAAFERLARAVAAGEAGWDQARPWAERTADRLCLAGDALQDWELELGGLLYNGGEDRAERALIRRSQHAIAGEVFQGTPAGELLARYQDAEVDLDLRSRADDLGFGAPTWAPPAHTWWAGT
jgi:hypothetical protein